MHGRLAGVQDKDGHAVVVEQLAERLAVHGTHFILARVLEEEIAVFARRGAAKREVGEAAEPGCERSCGQVGINTVPVKMDNVIGPARFLGVGERLLELLKRGRAKGRDSEAAAVLAEALPQAVGHGAELNVSGAAGAAGDVEETDPAIRRGRNGNERDVGIGLDADERPHSQGNGGVQLMIAHEFPGDGRGLGDAGGDFHPEIGQVVADGEPKCLGGAVGGEDLGVKLLAAVFHQPLDLLDRNGFHGFRVLEVVFEIPAEVPLFLFAQGELDVCLRLLVGLARPLQREADGVVAVSRRVLADVECGHGVNPHATEG